MQTIKLAWNNKGGVLIAVVVFSALVLILSLGVGQFITTGSERNRRSVEAIKVFWANEAGVSLGLRYLTLASSIIAVNEKLNVLDNSSVNGYSPLISITGEITTNDVHSQTVVATCDIIESKITCVSTAVTSLKNMLRWTYFSDQPDATSWVAKTINGDAHFNGYAKIGISMDATPHVTGLLTTATRFLPGYSYDRIKYPSAYRKGIIRVYDAGTPTYPNGNSSDYYDKPSKGWFETRFPRYQFTEKVDIKTVSPDASQFYGATKFFAGKSTTSEFLITLRDKVFDIDYYGWDNYWHKYRWIRWHSGLSIAKYPMIKLNRRTQVVGTINGRMTIITITPYSMVIAGNIFYKNADLATSDDILALVSGGDLEGYDLSSAGFDFTKNNCTVYAYLYAVNGKQQIYNLCNFTTLRTITVIGGMTLKQPNSTFCMCRNTTIHTRTGSYVVHNEDHGIKFIYSTDQRLVSNTITAPGIPIARFIDSERTVGTNYKYMNGLNEIQWSNKLQ